MMLTQISILSVALFHWNMALAEEGNSEILDGKPVKIVFPSGYPKLDWKSNEFTLTVELYVNNHSGKVSKIICAFNGKWVPPDSKEIEELLPAWQKPFLDAVCRAALQWEFEAYKRLDGSIPPGELGRYFKFRFVRPPLDQCKVEIKNYDGIVADDAPILSPAPKEPPTEKIPPVPGEE